MYFLSNGNLMTNKKDVKTFYSNDINDLRILAASKLIASKIEKNPKCSTKKNLMTNKLFKLTADKPSA